MKRAFLLTPAFFLMMGLWGVTTLVGPASAAAPLSTQPKDPEVVAAEQIVSQLDDADPDTRRVAALRLNSMGGGALEVVEAALKSDDLSPETRGRLEAARKFVRPRAALERARSARVKWRSDLFHNAYRDGGHTDPKLDADVHAAIDLYLAQGLQPLQAPPELHAMALAAFMKVTRAGCTDPMMLALAQLADGHSQGMVSRPNRGGVEAVMYACVQGNYPPVVKVHVWAKFCSWMYMEDNTILLGDLLEAALATPGVPIAEIDEPMQLFESSSQSLIKQKAWAELLDRYERLAPKAPGPLLLRAHLAIAAASSYRFEQSKISAFDQEHIGKYLKTIEQALGFVEKAYQCDPLAPETPRFAMRILRLSGEFIDPRNLTDVWFERAVAADPDDREPYQMKIDNYLTQGDDAAAALLAFGHDTMRSQNWRGGIALTIAVAHEGLAKLSPDRQVYFSAPAVWDDIKTTYEGCLINFPDDMERRCEFAKYATVCGHWDVADGLFNVIGDKPSLTVFGSESSYKYLRNKARRLAAEAKPAGADR